MYSIPAILMMLTVQSQASDILILGPFGVWSEYQLAMAIAEPLIEVGHNVTFISGFESNKKSMVNEMFIGESIMEGENIFPVSLPKTLPFIKKAQEDVVHVLYTNQDVLNVWENRNSYDAIIAYSLLNEIIAPFLIDYQGAYIGLCTDGIDGEQLSKQGNRMPRSVTPFMLVNYDENMNFIERVVNLVVDMIIVSIDDFILIPQKQSWLEKYFPGMPPIKDLYGSYSLLLINSHFAMDGLYPLLPNQVEVGTLTTKPPQPLPKDLNKFVEEAENGVIYFNLGQLVKSKHIPKLQLAMLIEAFRHLPQRVVWKYEGDDIENLPPNVLTRKWLPQQDILGHPATLVFISHCGNYGQQEAKYHGVPVLGVPVSFDQHRHAARLARRGYGRVLNWGDMTVELIIENINFLIKDTSYRERLKVVSAVQHDQKESAKERAVWWIEYAIRHKGAPHWHYAGKNLNVIQYHMLDVWAFLIAALMLWISLSYWCLRRCWRKVSVRKSKQD